jgi:hypothetical protein
VGVLAALASGGISKVSSRCGSLSPFRSDFVRRVVDFDRIEEWERDLCAALAGFVTDATIREIARTDLQFVEDTRDLLFERAGRDNVIDATLTWINSSRIAAYHGTRLTDAEVQSVRIHGLVPLCAEARRARIDRAFSGHAHWANVVVRLDQVLEDFGKHDLGGHREGQVHLTLSRAGLESGFNHYLSHGSEFDQRAAFELLGDEGKALLAKDGMKTIVQVVIAGDRALRACHPYFTVDDLRSRGDVPNLVNEVLKVWSYRLAHPGFDPRTLKVDCGLVFKQTILPVWIAKLERLPE